MHHVILPIFFVIKATQKVVKRVEIAPGLDVPPLGALMDDLTLLNPSTSESLNSLKKLEKQPSDWC